MAKGNSACATAIACYDPTGKSTVAPTDAFGNLAMAWSITYGSTADDASGNVIVYDSISTSGGLVIPQQYIALASTGQQLSDQHDGFFPLSRGGGLANYVAYLTQPFFTGGFTYFVTYFKANNAVMTPRVSMGRDPGGHGTWNTAISVNTQNDHWVVTTTSAWTTISVSGGTSTAYTSSLAVGTTILMDTGTTVVKMDATHVKAIYAALGGSCASDGTSCSYPCTYNTAGTGLLPTNGAAISLPFGPNAVALDMLAFVNGYSTTGNSGTCYGNLATGTDGSGNIVWGSPIYKGAAFKWDVAGNAISMATYN